MVVAKRW